MKKKRKGQLLMLNREMEQKNMPHIGSMQKPIMKRVKKNIITNKIIPLKNYQHVMEKRTKFYLKIEKKEKSRTMN